MRFLPGQRFGRPFGPWLSMALVVGLLLGCTSSTDAPATATVTSSSATSLNNLLDEIQAWEKTRQPLSMLYEGKHPKTIEALQFDTINDEFVQAAVFRQKLLSVDTPELQRQERLNQQVMIFKLADVIDRLEFGEQLIPFNAEGGFYNELNFVLNRLPFDTVADYDAYLHWLPQYADYLLSHIPRLKRGLDDGRVAPAVVVNNAVAMLKPLKDQSFDTHPAMQPFATMPAGLSAIERDRLRAAAERVFASKLQPVFRSLYWFFATEYAALAPKQPGLLVQPGGADYYANRVRFFTTLDLTPDQVFALGEREVERIQTAMDQILLELDFVGTRTDFIAQLRTDPKHYPRSAQALLDRAAWIAKTIEGKLPRWFDPLYQLPFTIEPVPLAIAPTYTSGRYLAGDKKLGRPGVYWVNTTRLNSRALFNLPALTLHESVPGHHLQHARTSELDAVHPFRNEYYISAFGEGWGLYAEYLGEEMGIYTTAYEQFGRLSYEMWRACRLVVDVGIHAEGWSRQQAIDYLGSRAALSEHEVETEIDRYIGWPGQALAYKLGELTIIGLRREAEQALGDKFDVKTFHEAVLANGALPLQLLIDQVRLSLGLSGEGLPVGLTHTGS